MRALSIQQPWAWLIVKGYKDIENRSWPTKHRGKILIHAGKKFDRDGYDFVRQNFPTIPLPDPGNFNLGGIVGEAQIVGCVRASWSPWFFGPFGFVLEKAKVSEFKPCLGKPGLFRPELTR